MFRVDSSPGNNLYPVGRKLSFRLKMDGLKFDGWNKLIASKPTFYDHIVRERTMRCFHVGLAVLLIC